MATTNLNVQQRNIQHHNFIDCIAGEVNFV